LTVGVEGPPLFALATLPVVCLTVGVDGWLLLALATLPVVC
jgi:hypothetical protein